MTGLLQRLLGDSTPDYDTETNTEERTLTRGFSRHEILVSFSDGDSESYTYDIFDGKYHNPNNPSYRRIRGGTYHDKHADIHTQELYRVVDAEAAMTTSGSPKVHLVGEKVVELTPRNINSRTIEKRTEMVLELPVTEEVERRTDTGEVVNRSFPKQAGEPTITRKEDRDTTDE